MSEPTTHTITITNQIAKTGTGFGVVSGTGESCFIPPRVMQATCGAIGDTFVARLVKNPIEQRRDHTPYMVTGMQRPDSETDDAVRQFVHDTLRAGDVWTVGELFFEYTSGKPLKSDPELFAAIDAHARAFFAAGECARFVLERAANAGVSKVWYTCHPDDADVAEWDDPEAGG